VEICVGRMGNTSAMSHAIPAGSRAVTVVLHFISGVDGMSCRVRSPRLLHSVAELNDTACSILTVLWL
jgi:hypothetical protein